MFRLALTLLLADPSADPGDVEGPECGKGGQAKKFEKGDSERGDSERGVSERGVIGKQASVKTMVTETTNRQSNKMTTDFDKLRRWCCFVPACKLWQLNNCLSLTVFVLPRMLLPPHGSQDTRHVDQVHRASTAMRRGCIAYDDGVT